MNIRWQNIIAIVPLFVAVGVTGGWLRIRSEERELVWGLHQEAEAAAVGIAAHISGERWEELNAAGWKPEASFERSISRVLNLTRVRQVFLADQTGKQILYQRNAIGTDPRKPLIVSDAIAALSGGPTTSNIFSEASGRESLFSYAIVKSLDGRPQGIVGVELGAEDYSKQWAASFRETVWFCAGVTALGLLAALFVAKIIRSKVAHLTDASERLANGEYDLRLQPGVIREVNDLASTFNTLGSVLGEIVTKTKRSLIEAEQFRTEEDLQSTYRSEFYPSVWRESQKHQFTGFLANDECVGDFFEVIETAQGTYALLGRVDADTISERMAIASAANTLSRELLKTKTPPEAWQRTAELFPLSAWICVFSDNDTGKIAAWKFDPELSDLTYEECEFSLDPLLFHSLSPEAVNQVTTYMRCAGKVAPLELCTEIAPLLRNEKQGALLIVGDY